MFTPIGFYNTPAVATSTSAYYTADVWALTDTNTTIGAYSKNDGATLVGKYLRGVGNYYVCEALCKSTAMVTALAGKTIQDFQIEYTVSTNTMATTAVVTTYQCDVNWTDTPTTEPRYNVPFGEITPWSNLIATDTLSWSSSTPTGVKTIVKSAAQNTLVQGWVNGTTTNNGLILGMGASYFASTITLSSVRFWVQYI